MKIRLLIIILFQIAYSGFSQEVNDNHVSIVDITSNNNNNSNFAKYCLSNKIDLHYGYKLYNISFSNFELKFAEIITSRIEWGQNNISSEIEGRLFTTNSKGNFIDNIPCYYSIVDNQYINSIKENYYKESKWINNGFIQYIDNFELPCFVLFELSPVKYFISVVTFDKNKNLLKLFTQDISSSKSINVISYVTRKGFQGLLIMNSTTHEAGTELRLISKYTFWYYDKSVKRFNYILLDE